MSGWSTASAPSGRLPGPTPRTRRRASTDRFRSSRSSLAGSGLTWVNAANLKVTLAATYVGERDGDLAGTDLDDYWTADAFLTWEPFDKRFELELAGYNIFDQEFELAPSIPGWGRSFTGSLKFRF